VRTGRPFFADLAHLQIRAGTGPVGNYSSENKVKRPLIESHYLFVASAAVLSSISGGFGGLNGSQTSES
jgi:hypothetical protein